MFLILAITALLLGYIYVKYSFNYWKRKGLLQLEPSFPFGNAKGLIYKENTFGQTWKKYYDYFRAYNASVGGYYFALKPELVLVDPELIKSVLSRDFSHFADRGTYLDEVNDPLSAHLFALPVAKWKPLRVKLTPTFTSGKMKMMLGNILACSEEMKNLFCTLVDEPIECKDILSRFTIDVIGSCAFGIDCNSIKNPDNEFRKAGLAIIEVKGIDVWRQNLALLFPEIMKFLGIPGMSPKSTNFFFNVVKQTVEYREQNNISRPDFLQLLIELRSQTLNTDDALPLDQIAAQCFVFFVAGFETSSTTMAFCLYELASNEEIQTKVRNEIEKVLGKYDNKITYEALMEMPYLDKVINETLRKYPPLPFINREATAEYKIPGTECTIPKGTPVVVSVEGLHWDPEYYPEPERFDPERFSEEEKSRRPHYSYLPFGEGPRICIGLRFGLLQVKVGLVQVLNNFQLSINSKTQVPLTMSTEAFTTSATGGIWLNMSKLSK